MKEALDRARRQEEERRRQVALRPWSLMWPEPCPPRKSRPTATNWSVWSPQAASCVEGQSLAMSTSDPRISGPD
ncbi:hypothetical protein RRG08_040820 [Elysia crispata]|uniref:Uncharacterized protein n=1 Tax=Elysia crispata TaxID=231223 RepID=A0AAE1DBZ2_9GAST|nr:hypothetical protein RRG08_040820 [Elysia crispata]